MSSVETLGGAWGRVVSLGPARTSALDGSDGAASVRRSSDSVSESSAVAPLGATVSLGPDGVISSLSVSG